MLWALITSDRIKAGPRRRPRKGAGGGRRRPLNFSRRKRKNIEEQYDPIIQLVLSYSFYELIEIIISGELSIKFEYEELEYSNSTLEKSNDAQTISMIDISSDRSRID